MGPRGEPERRCIILQRDKTDRNNGEQMAREFYRRSFHRLRYAAQPIRLLSESINAIIAGRAGKSARASKTIDPTFPVCSVFIITYTADAWRIVSTHFMKFAGEAVF